MKRILFLLVSVILLTSKTCSVPKSENDIKYSEGQTMYYEFDRNYTLRQVDSVCRVESISSEYGKDWIDGTSILRDETRKYIKQKIYIQNDSTFFILTDLDSIYNFKKRVIRTIRK